MKESPNYSCFYYRQTSQRNFIRKKNLFTAKKNSELLLTPADPAYLIETLKFQR
jgi:hypothetical protein